MTWVITNPDTTILTDSKSFRDILGNTNPAAWCSNGTDISDPGKSTTLPSPPVPRRRQPLYRRRWWSVAAWQICNGWLCGQKKNRNKNIDISDFAKKHYEFLRRYPFSGPQVNICMDSSGSHWARPRFDPSIVKHNPETCRTKELPRNQFQTEERDLTKKTHSARRRGGLWSVTRSFYFFRRHK